MSEGNDQRQIRENGEESRRIIVNFVAAYILENDFAPTNREIMEALSLTTTSQVHFHLDRLKKMGYVTYKPHSARTLRVTKAGLEHYQVQIVAP